MELTKVEVANVKKVCVEVNEAQLLELSELQLACIGGGIADPVAF